MAGSSTNFRARNVSASRDFPPGCGFSARKVSGIRSFPPGCGPDASKPTDADLSRIQRRLDKDNRIVCSDFSARNVADRRIQKSKPEMGDEECLEAMVYSGDKLVKTRPSVQVLRGSEKIVMNPRTISHAVIEERDKPIDCRPRKVEKEMFVVKNDCGGLGYEGSSKGERLASCKAGPSKRMIPTARQDVPIMKAQSSLPSKGAYRGQRDLGAREEEDLGVSLPSLDLKSSSLARTKVQNTLRCFQAICRKLLQKKEAGTSGQGRKDLIRIDLEAANYLKEGKRVNQVKMVGAIPGIEVGDEFHYRVELAIVGIHRAYQAGIEYMWQGGQIIATSIVASGSYDDKLEDHNEITYSGCGGRKRGEQQKSQELKEGNLALDNSRIVGSPVRFIRACTEMRAGESSNARAVRYVYYGLYTVEEREEEKMGPNEIRVYKFKLRRNSDQPAVSLEEVKRLKKAKQREGLRDHDISRRKESNPICVVNTIDNERAPQFIYIKKITYPGWYNRDPPEGCDCDGPCSNRRCSCAVKNGGNIPYNHDGGIVEPKPLVYECGPACSCPHSCYNRVSQRGPKIQLEIFKTEKTGWGVRSLYSISSGSFICEYIGKLIDDTEAKRLIGKNEYLLDIVDGGRFTIDAAETGNVARFINHSCSPNLFAQNVLYDEVDKSMAHVMFFAAENIPPLMELTFRYKAVVDADGNRKTGRCHCGSAGCNGRIY